MSYGQKKLWESKCQFYSDRLKVENHPEMCACGWRATYYWEDLDQGYNFASNFTSFKNCTKNYGFQSVRNPNFGNFKLPSWEF